MTAAEAEWLRCRAWIESALPFGGDTHGIEDIEHEISSGSMIFVPGEYCAVVLQVVTHPKFKVLDVFAGGGDKGGSAMREYCEKMDPYISFFAKEAGCKMVRHFCRPGSERLSVKLGYRKLSSVVVKDIE